VRSASTPVGRVVVQAPEARHRNEKSYATALAKTGGYSRCAPAGPVKK